MKVLALGADQGGCFKYRIQEPARVVSALGVDIEVSHGVDVEATQDSQGFVTVTEIDTDADLIIIQRPLDNSFTSMIEQAHRQGIATVVEIDDDFDSTNRFNVAYDGMHSYKHSGAYWVRQATSIADHITVSTPTLEKYAPHGRVSVVRNYIPSSIFDLTPRYDLDYDSNPIIGWTGSVQTHPTDLQVTRGVIGEIAFANDVEIGIVGDGDKVDTFLSLRPGTDVSATGWVHIDDYYEAIRDSMDIGIVPLELSIFNQAKSHLKGLEMGALGIPFVASSTREYDRFAAYGVGKTAKNPSEWKRHLNRWIDRPIEMQRDAKRYRELIYDGFTIEDHAPEWVKAWESAIAHRKAQS